MSSCSGEQQQVHLLHGDLDLKIHEARGLPNMDSCSSLLRCFCLRPRTGTPSTSSTSRSVPEGNGDTHHSHRIRQTSDPYVVVVVPGEKAEATLARTHVVRNSEAPRWETIVLLPLAHLASELAFKVKDADPFGAELIGTASIPAADIVVSAEKPIQFRWLPIFRDGRRPKPDTEICISATFIPVAAPGATTAVWRSDGGVPAYFPQRKGCEVKLYQDAHVEPDEVKGVDPKVFKPGRCWEDMCTAVLDARRLVYVVGWSVDTKVKLRRRKAADEVNKSAAGVAVEDMSLGELLKYKSRQPGVRVCLLLWDDRTSRGIHIPGVPVLKDGFMRTHDEETRKFFKDSSVICVLSPRHPSKKLGMFNQKVTRTVYSHHQKCLLVDTPASGTDSSRRRITAFLGGLDLCDGRYDTPSHTLFRGLHSIFHGDVHNPTFSKDDAAKGPRQPWHDLHCRLDGPAADDVLRNLQQRWSKLDKATKLWEMLGKATYWREGDLLNLDRIPGSSSSDLLMDDDAGDRQGRGWHAQVFRSVDSGSVKGFPYSWETHKLAQHHLLCKKHVEVDNSIHVAYIRAIRSAERFIYIENQYFIGSSYAWPSYPHRGASNLVPMEIALKVASKIRAGEPFAVYILIPMWPEGDPSSDQAQEILYWQNQTMETMYKVIAREIEHVGLKGARRPQDYLNFYCLGNREDMVAGEQPADRSDSTSPAALARRHRRFMVYVHSKGMIVDDEYVIIGSANINQRSLDGSRDTEIAVGAYQPRHTGSNPRGEVFGYRMSLWEEHLGKDVFRECSELVERPELPKCVKRVNDIARDNWERYADNTDQAGALLGHLMTYPVLIDDDGRVSALPGHETFPDVGGSVLGSTNKLLPDNMTM
ncbi:unnamed protein product [Urochloa decumbens]|uniref:Phospholipase D n=1 Tax=Urochloa decumbens TaxID=240449 RepID=A0ABC9C2Q6_9POAL